MTLRFHSNKRADASRVEHAFTRVDLLTLIVLVLLLAAWAGLSFTGERGRINRCAGNLNDLGKAMYRYASDHNEGIPAASVSIDKVQSTWDLKVFQFLKPGLAPDDYEKLASTMPRFFSCPSDHLQRSGAPRSYAMSSNDMMLHNWPPGQNTVTGIGLGWERQTVLRLLNEEALMSPATLPELKLSALPDPAQTVLLTELIAPNNVMGGVQGATVSGSAAQTFSLPDGGRSFHKGRLNYVMADGHVETLSGLQTGAIDGKAGIWTIRKGD